MEVTSAERAVLRLVAEGKSDAEIAGDFRVPVRTVQTRLHRFYERTGMKGRQATIWARENLDCCLRDENQSKMT